MKTLLVFFLCACCSSLFGQKRYPTKQEVEQAIKTALDQQIAEDNTSCDFGHCGEWYANNRDSAFYKKDTVRITNSASILYDSNHYCYFRIWKFKKGHDITQLGLNLCTEPPVYEMYFVYPLTFMGKSTKGKAVPVVPEKYNIYQQDSVAYLILYAGKIIFEQYRIIGLDTIDALNSGIRSFEMTLVRQRK